MRFLHPPLLIILISCIPVSLAIVECLHYRVLEGQPILKNERNPRCRSSSEYCVKIAGNSVDGKQPFIAGRCEHPDECKEHGDDCFARTDGAGRTEQVCCSSGNFSNHAKSVSTPITYFIALLIILSV